MSLFVFRIEIRTLDLIAMKPFLIIISFLLTELLHAQETTIRYLSGTDKDNTVEWGFMCTAGRNANKWMRIPVPSCWEMQGFGTFYYGWEEKAANEIGYYHYKFLSDKTWKGKVVRLVFEASMTDTEVKINGHLAGEMHQGGFYQFSYDVTSLLNYGKENLLEVKVSKHSSNESINDAERKTDFWLFGGIYRPVYLEVKPQKQIQSIALNADMNGHISVKSFTKGTSGKEELSMYVEELDGKRVLERVTAKLNGDLYGYVKEVRLWNQEQPYLYRIVVELKEGGKLLHRMSEKFGFRTVEFRQRDGFYLNGERIIFKGVNRHCFWPESGRTLNKQISLDDALLIKSMNMNAVRMSHYPPDKEFLDICDSLGLLVIDELCGWQKKYDTPTARRLVKEVVERDRNHPSIVLWANGNEGGWNRDVDDDYQLYDLQKRFVIHPWEKFRGTDTKHYPDYNYVTNSAIYDDDIFFPTEFMHGLYDGGHGASLKDFWDAMMQHRHPAGGFLWALLDEGVVRTDQGGRIDCKGNLAPDGIVGPYREREASYYAIKEIWSPIQVLNKTISARFDGKLSIENHYMFTDLAECTLSYRLSTFQKKNSVVTQAKGEEVILPKQSLAPGEKRSIQLKLPEGWQQKDVLYFTVKDPYGYELFTWSWPIDKTKSLSEGLISTIGANTKSTVLESDSTLSVNCGKETFVFSKRSGFLMQVKTQASTLSLSGGPVVLNHTNKLKELKYYFKGDTCYVEPLFEEKQFMKWCFVPGMPARLDYQFQVDGEVDCIGIGIDYPESKIRSMEWIGRGLFRVWKNRLQGMSFGLWRKDYNNSITGETWNYPEFKGYHADCRYVKIYTDEGSFSIIPSEQGLFFQMLQAERPKGAENDFTVPSFPATSLGFMYAIPPIGTKFQVASKLGPSGQKNMQLNWAPFKGSLWFEF